MLPGTKKFVQLFLREAAVAIWNQPFVLRAESPVETIGGGRVIQPNPRPLRRPTPQQIEALQQLQSATDLERAAAAVFLCDLQPWSPTDLPRLAGISDPDATTQQLVDSGTLVVLAVSPKRNHKLHHQVVRNWKQRLVTTMQLLHTQFPLQAEIERTHILRRFAYLADDPLIISIMKSFRKRWHVADLKKRFCLGRSPHSTFGGATDNPGRPD